MLAMNRCQVNPSQLRLGPFRGGSLLVAQGARPPMFVYSRSLVYEGRTNLYLYFLQFSNFPGPSRNSDMISDVADVQNDNLSAEVRARDARNDLDETRICAL